MERMKKMVKLMGLILALSASFLFLACGGDGGGGDGDDTPTCTDADGDGFFAQDGCGTSVDCDDSDVDNWVTCAAADSDSDGYYVGCDAYTTRNGPDCDDGNSTVYPGAPEVCDGIDHQCPGDAGYGLIYDDCTVGPMALIHSGCFDMGDAFSEGGSDELPVHNVCITSDFYFTLWGMGRSPTENFF
jgi:hypothetical protein